MTDRLWILPACGLTFLLALLPGVPASGAEDSRASTSPSRPNIVLIHADDMASGLGGFEDDRRVKTPRLDALAERAVTFTRCYVPTPQSAPSRACALTGVYPHVHGVTADGIPLPADADTLSRRLERAGYACGFVGKWYLGLDDDHRPASGFAAYAALSETPDSPEKWLDADVWVDGNRAQSGKFLTDWEGDRAIEFIESHKAGPFFLWLSFHAPHEPLTWPPGMEKTYPPESVELPKSMGKEMQGLPPTLRSSPAVRRFQETQNREQALREARSKYYAMITRMDENIGRVLDRLEATGLGDKTVVVFTSDHGFAIGEHQLYGTGPFFYDVLTRVPLIIRAPRLERASRNVEGLVSPVDLAPTLLQLAAVKPPMLLQGRSLVPLMTGTGGRAPSEVFFAYHMQEGYVPGGRTPPVTAQGSPSPVPAAPGSPAGAPHQPLPRPAPGGPGGAAPVPLPPSSTMPATIPAHLEHAPPSQVSSPPEVPPPPPPRGGPSGPRPFGTRPARLDVTTQPALNRVTRPTPFAASRPASRPPEFEPPPGRSVHAEHAENHPAGIEPPPPPPGAETPAPPQPQGPMTRPALPREAGVTTRPASPVAPPRGGTPSVPGVAPGSNLPHAPGAVPPTPAHVTPPVPAPQPAPAPKPPDFVCQVRGVIALQYKFIDYLQDQDVLIDLKRDPEELQNQANVAQYAGVLRVVKERLDRWRQYTRDR